MQKFTIEDFLRSCYRYPFTHLSPSHPPSLPPFSIPPSLPSSSRPPFLFPSLPLGGEHSDEPLELHHYGCRLLVGSYSDDYFTYSGHLWIDSVEFRYCGQGGYYSPRDPRYSIAFQNNFDSSRSDYVRRCSIHHGYNTAIGIHTSNGVEVSQNVVWRTTDSGIKAGGHGNEILDNLAMMTTTVQPNRPKDNHAVDFPATFDVDGGNIVRGNAGAGSTRLAFRFTGEPCLEGRRAPTYDEVSMR